MMKIHRRLAILFVLVALVLFATDSCMPFKKRAEGVQNRIVAVVSPEDRPFVRPAIDSLFSRAIYTPEHESFFEVEYVDPSEFDDVKYSHNLAIVSLFSPSDSTGDRLVRAVLPPNQFQMARRGENQVFAREDYFARGQVVAILTGEDQGGLSRALKERGQWIFDQFDAAFMKRQKKHIFKNMEQKKLSERLLEDYGWTMRIQHDWVMIREQPDKNTVWLGRSFPYRWISVYWVDHPPVKRLDSQVVIQAVRDYPHAVYDNINFTPYYERVEKTVLGKWDAWRVEGMWEHSKEPKGGPFVSFLFYDDRTDRLYHINLLIHYPGGNKMLLLRQMEVMARTFTVRPR